MRVFKFRAWWPAEKVMEYDLGRDIGNYFENETEVMQFTGLLDKNGREIYEGDILKAYPYGWPDNGGWPFDDQRVCIYAVTWSDYEGAWVMRDERPLADSPSLYTAGIHSRRNERLEIIGNIYENPELLPKEVSS